MMPAVSKLAAARLADWGVGMTVCIAAIAKDETIVVAQDMMVSTVSFSADIMAKTWRIAPNWWAMCSAEETAYITGISDRAVALLESADNVYSDVRKCFVQAYLDERQNQSEH